MPRSARRHVEHDERVHRAAHGQRVDRAGYREYPRPTRVLMRLIALHRGLPTDASVDVDYTDWDAVDAFADEIAALIPGAVAA